MLKHDRDRRSNPKLVFILTNATNRARIFGSLRIIWIKALKLRLVGNIRKHSFSFGVSARERNVDRSSQVLTKRFKAQRKIIEPIRGICGHLKNYSDLSCEFL